MIGLSQLVQFNNYYSYSYLIDTYQIYGRNCFLFMFVLSMARQLFGDNIICHTTDRINLSFLDTKCFINGTTTVDMSSTPYKTLFQHDYYQWVSVILLLEAFVFYLPFKLWYQCFGSYLRHITIRLDKSDACKNASRIVIESRGNLMFWKTLGLECFYAIYLVFQIFLIDRFLNRGFSLSGWKIDALDVLFPESGVCNFDFYSSGTMTEGKFICLLPLNVIYKKSFAFLYYMCPIMLSMHAIVFAYRIWTFSRQTKHVNEWWVFNIVSSCIENWILQVETRREFKDLLLKKSDTSENEELTTLSPV